MTYFVLSGCTILQKRFRVYSRAMPLKYILYDKGVSFLVKACPDCLYIVYNSVFLHMSNAVLQYGLLDDGLCRRSLTGGQFPNYLQFISIQWRESWFG